MGQSDVNDGSVTLNDIFYDRKYHEELTLSLAFNNYLLLFIITKKKIIPFT